ncbi:hypothetical protein GOBAR_AA11387 [Gossypium barbadense]|uniref:Uncharacterized protein n=1 Tax=Gossypium barbadense TaxID=3634 RepID=A0A2P5Y0Y6_GOSBA|nr:hypothetical protein GOBAR_AA11387 [Gossypium barbadense]
MPESVVADPLALFPSSRGFTMDNETVQQKVEAKARSMLMEVASLFLPRGYGTTRRGRGSFRRNRGISSSLSGSPILAIVSRNPLTKIGSPACPIVVISSIAGVALGSTELVLVLRLLCDQVAQKVSPLRAAKDKVKDIVKSSKKDKKRGGVNAKKTSSALKGKGKSLTKEVQALKDLENKKKMEIKNHQLREKVVYNLFNFHCVNMKPLIEEDLEAMHFGLHNMYLEDEDWQEFRDKLLVPLTTPPKETSVDATPLER